MEPLGRRHSALSAAPSCRALVPRERLSLRLCRAAQKPDVKEGGDAINLKVVTHDGSEIFFKAPRTSRARPGGVRAVSSCLIRPL